MGRTDDVSAGLGDQGQMGPENRGATEEETPPPPPQPLVFGPCTVIFGILPDQRNDQEKPLLLKIEPYWRRDDWRRSRRSRRRSSKSRSASSR